MRTGQPAYRAALLKPAYVSLCAKQSAGRGGVRVASVQPRRCAGLSRDTLACLERAWTGARRANCAMRRRWSARSASGWKGSGRALCVGACVRCKWRPTHTRPTCPCRTARRARRAPGGRGCLQRPPEPRVSGHAMRPCVCPGPRHARPAVHARHESRPRRPCCASGGTQTTRRRPSSRLCSTRSWPWRLTRCHS